MLSRDLKVQVILLDWRRYRWRPWHWKALRVNQKDKSQKVNLWNQPITCGKPWRSARNESWQKRKNLLRGRIEAKPNIRSVYQVKHSPRLWLQRLDYEHSREAKPVALKLYLREPSSDCSKRGNRDDLPRALQKEVEVLKEENKQGEKLKELWEVWGRNW